MLGAPYILIGIAVFIAIIFAYLYNRFAILGNRVENSLSQIDVQLRKRADLVPNLVKTVWGYVKHEKNILLKIAEARKALMGAQDIVSKAKAGNELSTALGRLFAIAENYPQLKANENFLQLQQELATIEDKIAYSRQFYNDSILGYNNLCTTFPGSFFANLCSKKKKEYLEIPETARAVPEINFE